MKVLVDTSVWSLALRRRAPAHAAVDELRRLVVQGRAGLVGPVRQELLSGIRDRAVFERLRDHLSAFPDEPITSEDYVRAADCLNICRAKGIQGSNTDFLLCAVAERSRFPIFTTDDDFLTFSRVLPVRLHRPEQGPQP
jgi:predicted nucleic acid-binding protein